MTNPWKFALDDEQAQQLQTWRDEQDRIVLERQRRELAETGGLGGTSSPFFNDVLEDGPYYGAVGGELTFTFPPTSIGTFVTVKHSGTGTELDLTGDL